METTTVLMNRASRKREARKSTTKQESRESRQLIEHAFAVCRAVGIGKLLVRADLLTDISIVRKYRDKERIVWITDRSTEIEYAGDRVVTVPDLRLSRVSQIKIGLFVAVLREYIGLDESIVCLSGVAGSKRIDTLVITNPRRDFPWIRSEDFGIAGRAVPTNVLETVLQVALGISVGGHEGKPVGTTFVIGDARTLDSHLRQLILNPCEGHSSRVRSVYNPEFIDTLRELAALDGAFIVNRKGVVESAATYLDAPTKHIRIRAGLGARHTSAAAITVGTGAIAVVVSESSGAVSVFRNGRMVLELEKPEPKPGRKRG